MTGLLMTRPRAASDRFVAALPAALRARLTVVHSPLLEIVRTTGAIDLADARGIVFTSANGVATAAGLTGRRDLPCFCVGEATTRAARAAGWTAHCAGENAEAMVAALIATPPEPPLMHLRGVHARGDVAARLTAAGTATRELAIYDQQMLSLTDAALALLNGPAPVIVPLFSPRTARQFADLAGGRAPLLIAALSRAVADPLESLDNAVLEVAKCPDSAAMVETVARLAEQAIRVEGGSGAQ